MLYLSFFLQCFLDIIELSMNEFLWELYIVTCVIFTSEWRKTNKAKLFFKTLIYYDGYCNIWHKKFDLLR